MGDLNTINTVSIGGHTKTAGLMGYPVGHTKSPLIHNTLARFYGDDVFYMPFEVLPEKLCEAVKGAAALGLIGLNVTVPHKSAVMPYLIDIDPPAKAIGAVNTLAAVYSRGKEQKQNSPNNRNDGINIDKTGSAEDSTTDGYVIGYKGYNTDILGLSQAMKRGGFEIEGKTILILGAGGAARAVAFLCAYEKAGRIIIANRSKDKADGLKNAVINNLGPSESIETVEYPDLLNRLKEAGDADICIQCTSVGLYPNVDDCVLNGETEEVFDHIQSGIDLIYKPEKTAFMKKLEERGKKTMNGLSMLMYQGVIAYEIFTGRWNGSIQTDDEVLDEIYRKLRE